MLLSVYNRTDVPEIQDYRHNCRKSIIPYMFEEGIFYVHIHFTRCIFTLMHGVKLTFFSCQAFFANSVNTHYKLRICGKLYI